MGSWEAGFELPVRGASQASVSVDEETRGNLEAKRVLCMATDTASEMCGGLYIVVVIEK